MENGAPSTPVRQVPKLRLQTDSSLSPTDDIVYDGSSSQTATSRFDPLLPAVLDPQTPIGKALSRTAPKNNEFRKVLDLLLSNLRNRKRPPSIFDDARGFVNRDGSSLGMTFNAVRGAVRLARRPDGSSFIGSDDSDEEYGPFDSSYSTDATAEHLTQLRDVLILSDRLGWDILAGPSSVPIDTEEPLSPRTPFRRRRQSLRRSRSKDRRHRQISDALHECISLLEELVSEDCRYLVKNVRLIRPPRVLQALCLDFAQCLITNQRQDVKSLIDIGFALLPAFTSFGPESQPRLLRFFEENIIRGALELLNNARSIRLPTFSVDASGLRALAAETLKAVKPTGTPLLSITVDEPEDDQNPGGWLRWSPAASPLMVPNVLSTTAPSQSTEIYQLSALVSHLLCNLLEYIDWSSPQTSVDTLYRLHRLLDLIMEAKPDSYLDLLEIIAYHTERARHPAVSLLLSYWPRAIGHASVAKAFPLVSYQSDLNFREVRQSRLMVDECAYTHQFISWGFSSPRSTRHSHSFGPDSKPSGHSLAGCHVCSQSVEGMGLLCTLCLCVVHLGCFDNPDGQFFIMYPAAHDSNTQKVALARFSHVLPHRRASKLPVRPAKQHVFRPVNLFTLTLCLACQEPLWGVESQGLECSGCRQFVHYQCLQKPGVSVCGSTPPSAKGFSIERKFLRQSFLRHYKDMIVTESDIPSRSHEEISICYGVIWTQLEIFRQGVASGSLVVVEGASSTPDKKGAVEEWEIHRIVKLYEAWLQSGKLRVSDTTAEYREMATLNSEPPAMEPNSSILFDRPLLMYMTALLKSPRKAPNPVPPSSSGHLSVYVNDDPPPNEDSDEVGHPFEIVSLSHMRDVLGFEFGIYNDAIARYLLSHMHCAGLFHRLDRQQNLFERSGRMSDVLCIFPVPLVIDYSTNVETLVSAIAVCLEDLDISTNEVGFLLLTKRCWPNGMASDYAMQRLMGLIVSWISSDDERLLKVARDFVARALPLPGVRTAIDGTVWPDQNTARVAGLESSSRSGDSYQACRRELMAKYAARWMQALHDQDPQLYAKVILEQAIELSRSEVSSNEIRDFIKWPSETPTRENRLRVDEADRTLKAILKLNQQGVMFSTFETVFGMWLDYASELYPSEEYSGFAYLRRLTGRDVLNARRFSVLDPLHGSDAVNNADDPWQIITGAASDGLQGLSRSIEWTRLFAMSSVTVPQWVLQQLWLRVRNADLPFSSASSFTDALFSAVWIDPTGRHELIAAIAEMHVQRLEDVLLLFSDPAQRSEAMTFVKLGFAACMLLYGCDRRLVQALGLVEEGRAAALTTNKQRQSSQPTPNPDLAALGVDGKLITSVAYYIERGPDNLKTTATAFLCSLFTEPSMLAEDAVNRYLSASGRSVYRSAWALWDLSDDQISPLRVRLLLRLLAASPAQFGDILHETFQASTKPSLRSKAITRLLRITLALNDPSLLTEGNRYTVLPIFTYLLKTIWDDKEEEVRLSANVSTQTLLPSHFAMMSMCYDEAFNSADLQGRLELTLFLLQLHPHFPSWQVLSWRSLTASLHDIQPELTLDSKGDEFSTSVFKLRVALVSLGLHMIGNGISADLDSLLILKQQLALVVGFSSASVLDTSYGVRYVRLGQCEKLVEEAFPCLTALVRALDAPTMSALPPAAMGVFGVTDELKSPFVGAIFIDVALPLVTNCDFQTLLYLPARAILDLLVVITQKYDITRPSLSHLQEQITMAVQRITHAVNLDISYDLRSIALIMAQAFLKRWPTIVIKILSRQIFSITMLLTDLGMARENLLVAQGTTFLEVAFSQFSTNGLFVLLLKYPLQPEFFHVIRHVMASHSKNQAVDPSIPSLKEAIISDTFTRLTERPDDTFDKIFPNLKMLVEIVHHQNYTTRLIQDITQATMHLSRIASDVHGIRFNPNPWLEMCMTVIRHNKAVSRDLLAATEVFLKVVITRFDLELHCVSEVLLHTATFYRREESSKDLGLHTAAMILGVLSDGLRGRSKLPSNTLNALLTAVRDVLRINHDFLPPKTLPKVSADCAYYIYAPPSGDAYTEIDFTSTMIAADMVHEAAKSDLSFLHIHFGSLNDRLGVSAPSVRSWNVLALAALEDSSSTPGRNLFPSLKAFSCTYANSLLSLSGHYIPPDTSALDLNQAFTAIKLWMMLSRRKRSQDGNNHDDLILSHSDQVGPEESEELVRERAVWNELWSPFEALLLTTIADDSMEDLTPLTLSIWSSFADLVIFIHQIRSPVALESFALHMSFLKQLKKRNKNESVNNKFSRALKCVIEPPSAIPLEVLIAQSRSELLAGEKLAFALERRRIGPDRGERRQERRKENRTIA